MLKRIAVLVCGLLPGCATPAPTQSAQPWSTLATADVEAFYRVISEDHPAMSPELDDTEFRARFDAAHAQARERAAQVTSYDGYVATMSALAGAAEDRHVTFFPLYQPDPMRWAGIVLGLRGETYVVIEHDARGEPLLVGAVLETCDGVAAAEFARRRLAGFRAVWSIEAQRIQSAPYVLINDGNPLAPAPTSCVFALNGDRREVAMNYRFASRESMLPRLRRAANRGAAGYGVRDFAGGKWIALQGLGDQAPAVVAAVEAQADALRRAPIVVVDLRGNGGGSSAYGRSIARALFGDARVDAISDDADARDCPSVWRLSPRNLAQLRSYPNVLTNIGAEAMENIRREIAAAEATAAAGRDLSGDPGCGAVEEHAPPADLPPSAPRGRVVLLTDTACFSSCLLMTQEFRDLGALHVGQATDANTHYSESRTETLPSGLALFGTLQAIITTAPRNIGPFEPAVRYDGDMMDQAALEAWVISIARR